MEKIKIGIVGLGRIGQVHLENIHYRIANAEVVAVMNPSEEGQSFARDLGVPSVSNDPDVIFGNEAIDAVLICSPSNTHAAYIKRAAKAGKAILCEKPLDLSLDKIQEILEVTQQYKVPLMVAFNQRFDPDFAQIKETVSQGKIGDLRMIKITSRDPSPPPISYIKGSGGLFLDMTIHDIDMAKYIADSEVKEVYALGKNLIDPAIGEAGDIDTGVVILTFENEVTAIIENSRQAAYGYDQRLEVFGSKGMAQADHNFKNNHVLLNETGVHRSCPMDFFMDRYAISYRNQTNSFIQAIAKNETPPVTGEDGLKATAIALAANMSMQLNRPV
ncbi:inositol 2-dehydrogenase, partial [Zobellia sp.]|nr:inositol 2-dehydrogenase [Zobellia sp.]